MIKQIYTHLNVAFSIFLNVLFFDEFHLVTLVITLYNTEALSLPNPIAIILDS